MADVAAQTLPVGVPREFSKALGSSGQWISFSTLPHCWGAVGTRPSATPGKRGGGGSGKQARRAHWSRWHWCLTVVWKNGGEPDWAYILHEADFVEQLQTSCDACGRPSPWASLEGGGGSGAASKPPPPAESEWTALRVHCVCTAWALHAYCARRGRDTHPRIPAT